MKTKTDIQRLANSIGAQLEEDEGYRDMRVFQIVAPEGQWWSSGVKCLRVAWATGLTKHATEHNESEWRMIQQAVRCGLKPIPEDQQYLYADD